MTSWGFVKDGAAVLPASNVADPLRSTPLTATEVVVREAVQNSLDERRADADKPVRVRFHRTVLVGDDKRRLVDGLRLRDFIERRAAFRESHHWFSRGHSVLAALNDLDAPLPVLTISDFHTNGLGGRWNRRGADDRFFNLVLSIGGSRKWDEDGDDSAETPRSLGSYGFGKMAFAMCSDIRTIVYHSTFRPDAGSAGVTRRAMASAFLPEHSMGDVNYVGQAYLGCDSDEEGIPRAPLVDADASAWVRALGLPDRADADTGTTIAIPAAGATMQEIVDACETWWWPRLRDRDPLRRVEFEFVDGDNEIRCNPRSRAELSPFLDCHRLLPSHKAGDGYELHDVKVQPVGGSRLAGRLVLKAVPAASAPESDLESGGGGGVRSLPERRRPGAGRPRHQVRNAVRARRQGDRRWRLRPGRRPRYAAGVRLLRASIA